MKCSRCTADNASDARFCEDSGAKLEQSCPTCDQPLAPGKNFCRSCGASVLDVSREAGRNSTSPTCTVACERRSRHEEAGRIEMVYGERHERSMRETTT